MSDFTIGVVTFPGTLDDHDALRAARLAGAQTVNLWHDDTKLSHIDAVVLPGGFSYGDYLRCGAISSLSPIMQAIIDGAKGGLPVLGICNGFQVLCESHLLPGALIINNHQKFNCGDQKLIVENTQTAWTSGYEQGQEITIPLKNGEGQFVASQEELAKIEEQNQVVFRYTDPNPNGSVHNIAGLTNPQGNVVGLMPHPEHAVEALFGTDTAEGKGLGTDGITIFESVMNSLVSGATR
ncbi:MAG: phosphoribosylformylglycinamidine synthase subunit PurQ [Micrococcaceae bacterium]